MTSTTLDEAFKSLNEATPRVPINGDVDQWHKPESGRDPLKDIKGFYKNAFGYHYIDLYDEVTDALSPINDGDMNKYQLAKYVFKHCFTNPAYDSDDIIPAPDTEAVPGCYTIEINASDPARAQEVAHAFDLPFRTGRRANAFYIDVPADAPVVTEFVNPPAGCDASPVTEEIFDKKDTSDFEIDKKASACPECGKNPCECGDETLEEALDEFGIPYDDFEYDLEESLNEDVASSIPVQPLPTEEVREFVTNIPAPTGSRPPRFFKLGYITELGAGKIASKYRGGRGSSEDDPKVRIFKCIEYSQLMTGVDPKRTKHTKDADAVLGADRHTGEKTGFSYDQTAEGEDFPRIGHYANGEEALQVTLTDACIKRVKFFISFNDEDLHVAEKDEIAKYLIPTEANKILNGREKPVLATREDGSVVTDTPINRLKLAGIYMIGSHGHSVM